MARGIVGIEGETFLLPIRKESHQSSAREMGIDAEFENLSDPIAGHAHSVHGCDVTQHELALRLNLDLLSTFTKCPLEGAACLRVSKIDHPMSICDQLLWIGRVAMFLQVDRRGHGKNSCVQQSSGEKSGWARLAEANCQIVPIRDQISEALPRDQVYLELGIRFKKSTQLRSENELREVRVHVDAESPPNGHFTFGQCGGRIFERRHNRADGLVNTLIPCGSSKLLGRKVPQFVCDAIIRDCGAGRALYPAGTVAMRNTASQGPRM